MTERYNRRLGIEWDDNLYNTLIKYLVDKKINSVQSLLMLSNIPEISKSVFPKYGARKRYVDKIKDFIDGYCEIIIEDVIEIKENGNAVAPELKLWLKYKKSLILAMTADNIKTDVNIYLQTKNFSLPCDTKRIILRFIYDIEDKDIEHWQIKKLSNVLFFNKQEICEGIQKVRIEHKVIDELNDNNKENSDHNCNENENSFSVFNETELDISRLDKNKNLTCLINKNLQCNNLEDCQIAKPVKKLVKNKDNFTSNYLVNKKSECYNSEDSQTEIPVKKRTECVKLSNRANGNIFDLYNQNDDNDDQLLLFKKLVILNITRNNNRDIQMFMSATKIVNHQTKLNILKIIYAEEIKSYYIFLMDSLITYRYLIKKYVKEALQFFNKNSIDITTNFEQTCNFEDDESIFIDLLYHERTSDGCSKIFQELNNESLDYLHGASKTLALVDDIATAIIIDWCILKMQTHKIHCHILESCTKSEMFKEKTSNVVHNYKKTRNLADAANNLCILVKQYLPYIDVPKANLVKQISCYLNFIDSHSGITIKPCYRYKRENNIGAKVCSTKEWPEGSIFKCLNGFTTTLKSNELKYLEENKINFSVIETCSNQHKLWLGPAAYVNHSCEPNSKMHILRPREIVIQALQDIKKDEEITISYGSNYFSAGECECTKCINFIINQ